MKSITYTAIIIASILVFGFVNVLAQEENTTGMPQDQTSGGSESTAFNPEEIIKKEARGLGDANLGEVQEVTGEFIVTQKGTVDKDVFYIPKNLVDHFDGSTVFLQ